MDGIVVAFMVPAVIFVTFVAPIWVYMHYKAKQKSQSELSQQERAELEQLAQQAGAMIERIETLEAILDDETPEWRGRAGAQGEQR